MLTRLGSRLSAFPVALALSARTALARLRDRSREESGAMTIEYILIIALIAIIIITLFTILLWPILRPALVDLIDRIQKAIAGGGIE
jgi:Flp pilus assembly pilin Flp